MAHIPFIHVTNPGKKSTSTPSTTKKSGTTTDRTSGVVGSGNIPTGNDYRGAEADIAIENQKREEQKQKEFENNQKAAGKMKWKGQWVDKPENFNTPLEDSERLGRIEKILKKQKGNGNYYDYVDPKTNTPIILTYIQPKHYVADNYPEDKTETVICSQLQTGIILPKDVYERGKYAFFVRVNRKPNGAESYPDNNLYILNLETQEMTVIPCCAAIVRNDGELMDVYKRYNYEGHHVFNFINMKEMKGLADDPDNVM